MLARARLAAVSLALVGLGCPGGRTPGPVADGGLPLRAPGAVREPVLALPPGWKVTPVADGALRGSSPRGLPVLRAEVQRGVGLPTAATLRTGFLGGLRHLHPHSEVVTEAPGFISMRFVLEEPDGGQAESEALLSATALGEDTLLCSTARGASSDELDAVAAACQAAASAVDAGR